jgi:hypothetical protein
MLLRTIDKVLAHQVVSEDAAEKVVYVEQAASVRCLRECFPCFQSDLLPKSPLLYDALARYDVTTSICRKGKGALPAWPTGTHSNDMAKVAAGWLPLVS